MESSNKYTKCNHIQILTRAQQFHNPKNYEMLASIFPRNKATNTLNSIIYRSKPGHKRFHKNANKTKGCTYTWFLEIWMSGLRSCTTCFDSRSQILTESCVAAHSQ